MTDTPSNVGSHVLITMVGMDEPFFKQEGELFRIKRELAAALGFSEMAIGHCFGSTNWLQFHWSAEIDATVVERGLEAFQKAHPKFKIEFEDQPFVFA